jgi:hypothetical protein
MPIVPSDRLAGIYDYCLVAFTPEWPPLVSGPRLSL